MTLIYILGGIVLGSGLTAVGIYVWLVYTWMRDN